MVYYIKMLRYKNIFLFLRRRRGDRRRLLNALALLQRRWESLSKIQKIFLYLTSFRDKNKLKKLGVIK